MLVCSRAQRSPTTLTRLKILCIVKSWGARPLFSPSWTSSQEAEAPAKVVDLMAALRKSLDSVSESKKKPAKSSAPKASKAKRKRA